jgi:hypothetical protein
MTEGNVVFNANHHPSIPYTMIDRRPGHPGDLLEGHLCALSALSDHGTPTPAPPIPSPPDWLCVGISSGNFQNPLSKRISAQSPKVLDAEADHDMQDDEVTIQASK